MSDFYNGKPGLVSIIGAATIASSTNATPIEITTSAAHGLTSGDVVQITGHNTNYSANGIWQITHVSSTKFTLQTLAGVNSVGVGVGGATGTVTIFSDGTFQIPDDGDPANAAAFNVAYEALGDRTAWALQRLYGAKRLVQQRIKSEAFANFNLRQSETTTMDTWAEWTDITTELGSDLDLDVVAGDVIELEYHSTSNGVAGETTGYGWRIQEFNYGTSPSSAGAGVIPGCEVAYKHNTTVNKFYLYAVHTLATLSVNHGAKIRPYMFHYGVGAATTARVDGPYMAVARVWR